MYDEKTLMENPEKIKPLTGLEFEEFFRLVEDVEDNYSEHRKKMLENEKRQRAVGGGRRPRTPLILRVFALLIYLRLYVPQRTVSAIVSQISQSRISRDLRRLLPVLCEHLPVPEIWETLPEDEAVLKGRKLLAIDFPGGQALIDAQEQRINRPKDNEVQKKFYSGKKKAHTIKTQLVSGTDHDIKAISTAVPGSQHDKKLATETKTVQRLPDGIDGLMDKAYQGIEKEVETKAIFLPEEEKTIEVPRIQVFIPFKKPPNKKEKGAKKKNKEELTPFEKSINKLISNIRVRIEHCIGWLRNWKIMDSRFRCSHEVYTPIMQVVCGLVNRQTQQWRKKKAEQIVIV